MKLLTALRDTLDHGWLPACIAMLPWPLAAAALRAASRLPLLSEEVGAATEAAARAGFRGDRAAFERRARFYRLLDRVDLFLSRSRGNAWMRRHYSVHGRWPPSDEPFVAVFFHYGTGLWTLRDLAHHVGRARFVSAQLRAAAPPDRPVRRLYARWRTHEVERVTRAPVIWCGGARARIDGMLRARDGALVAAGDVPDARAGGGAITMFGRPWRVAHGALELALSAGASVVVFSEQIDASCRRRSLVIDPPIAGPLDEVLRQLGSKLEARVRADPAAWHFWPQFAPYSAGTCASAATSCAGTMRSAGNASCSA